MHISCYLCLLLFWLAVSLADTVTVSLGDIGQYVGSATSTPTLSGSVIEFDTDGKADGGLGIFLSSDLQKNINIALNSNCDLDDLASLAIACVASILSFIIALFNQGQQPIPVPIQLDTSHVSGASALATASTTVIILESGSPITVTPSPEPPDMSGTNVSSITTVTSAVNGYQPGDVAIVRISNQCPAGEVFIAQKLQKRLDDLGPALCASLRLVMNTTPGGMFPELIFLQPRAFPWTSADAVSAMNVAIAFARAQAPDLGITPDRAAALGTVAFAIAWEVLVYGQTLSTSNVIPAASLEGATMTAPPCPTQYCNAGCRMIGAIADCSMKCSMPTDQHYDNNTVDGDRYYNMLGHSNSAMDYVWVHSTRYILLYKSFGDGFPQEPPYWGPHYQIWAASDQHSSDIDRRDLHLAD
ncbi:hypothetical protein BGW36DRAFT_439860 [Talaromyces proteolyticus]|uniref:Uncharacterized protein n=1 Tax=Talaromyces proteolyticus TaxID=1131652 RepID=A0AAD4KEW9_9EURO|nr:uncharacterized protein BGW36DRAFT_439860 [Talaromyces proteolyticus]KAH8690659.1 hypothetical protein BGW36DRAFT_439860 [Talaromyces proteolyticus]